MKPAMGVLFALWLTAGFPARVTAQTRELLLATTTSTRDAALLDAILPVFTRQTGIAVKVIAVGSGQALELGRRGDADVVLSHAPDQERALTDSGYFVRRLLVMHNDFLIVGPASDPAALAGSSDATAALRSIAARAAAFVSRGDRSGTHQLELGLWRRASIAPPGPGAWYVESGQGMGATLIIASEKDAYALTDRGTYLAFRKRLRLTLLLQGDAPLLNPYHVLEVNPARHPRVNAPGGKAFADFLVSAEAQEVIRTFGVERHGQPLFFPDGTGTARGGG